MSGQDHGDGQLTNFVALLPALSPPSVVHSMIWKTAPKLNQIMLIPTSEFLSFSLLWMFAKLFINLK